MRTTRRRQRRFDPLATPAGARFVCDELRAHRPDIIPNSDKKLFSLLNAVRHIERYSATDSRSGRPGRWKREDLLEVARHLRAILDRETLGRVSVSSFIGIYLRVLNFPPDLASALEKGEITLQEATALARLTKQKLEVSASKAQVIRREIISAHVRAGGSQNSLRERVKEILGEANIVSSETMSAAAHITDQLLEVDPQDKRHLFYEQMKNLFYAMREIKPEDIDDKALADFSEAADHLFAIIHSIMERRIQMERSMQKFCI